MNKHSHQPITSISQKDWDAIATNPQASPADRTLAHAALARCFGTGSTSNGIAVQPGVCTACHEIIVIAATSNPEVCNRCG